MKNIPKIEESLAKLIFSRKYGWLVPAYFKVLTALLLIVFLGAWSINGFIWATPIFLSISLASLILIANIWPKK